MLSHLRHRIRRVGELLTSSTYRAVVRQRLVSWLIRRLNPRISYFGIDDGRDGMILHAHDSVVTPYTLALGSYQKDDVERVVHLARQAGRLRDGAFFDVGGNIGTTSIYAAAYPEFSHIYCFEPVPANVRLVRANVGLNNLSNRITIIDKAVSAISGNVTVALSTTNHGDHRVALGEIGAGRDQRINIPAVSLDDFVLNWDFSSRVAFLWVDTQGFEGFVLKGAIKLLERDRPPLCLEFWPYGLERSGSLESLLAILPLYYDRFYDLRVPDGSPQPISQLRSLGGFYGGEFRHTDILVL